MKKILFIKIGALGDLTYALPAAKALKETTHAHITWLVGKSYQTILRGHIYIDDLIIVDDKKLYSKNWLTRTFELARIFFKCSKRFDIVVIAHRDPLYYRFFNLFARKATFQLVRDTTKNPERFIHAAPMQLHESLAIKKLTLAAASFCAPATTIIPWNWDYTHIERTSIYMPANYIALHLGGGLNSKTEFQLKCWPHWQALVLRLLNETDLNLVFVGSPAEEKNYAVIADAIKQRFPEKLQRCFNLMSDLTLVQLVDVIRRCQLFIGVDSGPLHIADSLDKNSIGLYGPTSSVSWGLLSKNSHVFQHKVPCSPCYKDDSYFPPCHFEHRCMQQLAVEPVFTKILDLSPAFCN
jgi:ADP-heptose:LPS heptosyltransferase